MQLNGQAASRKGYWTRQEKGKETVVNIEDSDCAMDSPNIIVEVQANNCAEVGQASGYREIVYPAAGMQPVSSVSPAPGFNA